MVFSSPFFLFIFLPVVVAVYFAIPKKFRALRNYFLVVCSLFFYAWGEPKFVYYMLTVVFINYALGLIASKFIDNDKNIKEAL